MEQYTASNGVVIASFETAGGATRYTVHDATPTQRDGYTISEVTHYLDARDMDALREFFRAEEDERLGRWRFNDHIVVYPKVRNVGQVPGRGCLVLDELEVRAYDRWENPTTTMVDFSQVGDAARAFFDAHPEPKPWHDAKPGDHWALHIASGVELAYEFHLFKVTRWMNRDGWYFVPTDGGSVFALNDSAITAGRRIWPEDAS